MRTDRRLTYVFLSLVLAALVFAAYSNALQGGFVYDDNEQIIENAWIKDFQHLPDIFSEHSFGFAKGKEHGTTYRPLVFTVYSIEYSLFGLAPWGWHLINILLHAVNTVIVFFIASSLLNCAGADHGRKALPAFAAAALFALHPVNSEVVSWVGCVPELVYTLLCLSSLYLYMKSRESGKTRVPLVWASAALFFVALFAKETAISLPLLVFVYDLTLRKPKRLISFETFKRYLPYAILTAVYFAIRLKALGGMAPRDNMYPYLNGWQYVLNACALFVNYLKTLIFPYGNYPFQLLDPVFLITEPKALISVVLIFALLSFFLFFRKRVDPLYLLASAFILFPILPALYLPGLSRAPFAERYLYLPSAGFAIILAMLLRKALVRAEDIGGNKVKRGAIAAFIILAVLYALSSNSRNSRWKDDITLWKSSLEGSSGNYYAMYQLGTASLRKDNLEDAIAYFDQTVRTIDASKHPDVGIIGDSRLNLAYAYRKKGQLDEASAEYLEILKLYPTHPVSNYELGSIYMKKGMLDEAIVYYGRAASNFRDPMDIRDALLNIGNCFIKKGNFKEALSSYQEALRITPGDPAVLKNISVLESLSNKQGGLD